MKEIFPIEGASVIVSDDMCDMNGHMNVRHYQTIPMDYDGNFYTSLGFGEDYIAKGFSSFTAEQNIRYLKECLKGEKLTPRFRMLNVNKKLYTTCVQFVKSQMKWQLWLKALKSILICLKENLHKYPMKSLRLW